MPSWFGKSTADSNSSSSSQSDTALVRQISIPKDRQPPPPLSPHRTMFSQPSPKFQPPVSPGLGTHMSKSKAASAAEKLPRFPLSTIQADTGAAASAAYPDLGSGPANAGRTVRFNLPPTTAETRSHKVTHAAAKVRGPEYVTVTRVVPEQVYRSWPSPTPIPAPAAAAARRGSYTQSVPGPRHTAADVPRVGPFKLLKTLNGGAFGASYVAHDTSSGRVVCARVFKKERMRTEEKIRRGLHGEVGCYKMIAASPACDRAYLMELHGTLQDERSVVFVMPLMQCDLLDALNAAAPRRLDRRLVQRWIAQLALGIDALHRMGIIHRDIKPENILLDAPHGNVRITDLNTAFIVQAGDPLKDGEVYEMDSVGSQPYIAWEMEKGRWYGKMVDWWALGCVMFDLLTNTILFKDCTARKRYARWDSKFDGKSFLQYMGDLTKDEESVIGGLIDLYPSSRFQLRHLQHHTYFIDENRMNVFDGLLREQPTDLLTLGKPTHPSLLQVEDALKDTPLCHATPRLPKCERGEEKDYEIFSGFGWLNNRGIWRP